MICKLGNKNCANIGCDCYKKKSAFSDTDVFDTVKGTIFLSMREDDDVNGGEDGPYFVCITDRNGLFKYRIETFCSFEGAHMVLTDAKSFFESMGLTVRLVQ